MSENGNGSADRRDFLTAAAGVALAGAGVALLTGTARASLQQKKKLRWGFLIDLRRCIGCKACSVACKTEFDVRLGCFRSSVKELESGTFPNTRRTFLPWLCNHCEKPPCIVNCPVDEVEATFTFPDGEKVTYKKRATYQRPDGIVLIDQDRCVGCGNCVRDCPYKVRYLDPVKPAGGDPDARAADKCDMCVHRLDHGIVPSCVNTCQGRARMVGDLNDSESEISKLIATEKVDVLLRDKGTEPRCLYIALDHDTYTKGKDTRDEAVALKRR